MAPSPSVQHCSPRFVFKCPKRWEALRATDDTRVRFCETCAQNVYFCETFEQGLSLAREGRCVALQNRRASASELESAALASVDPATVDRQLMGLIPRDIALKYLVFPVRRSGSALVLAADGPLASDAVADLMFLTGFSVETVHASADDIRVAIDAHYVEPNCELGILDTELEEQGPPRPPTEDGPVVRLVDLILLNACKRQVSHIVFDHDGTSFRVLFDKGGVLCEEMVPPRKLWDVVVARLRQIAHRAESPESADTLGEGTVEVRLSKRRVERFEVVSVGQAPPSRLTLRRIPPQG